MSYETLVAVFGWMTVLNFGLLILGTFVLTVMRQFVLGIHSRMLKLEEDDLNRAYVTWIANYKILVLVFCFTPYLALRLAA